MSEGAPGSRVVRPLARVVGVLGGSMSVVAVGSLVWEGIAAWLKSPQERTLDEGLMKLTVLVFSPVLLLMIGVSVRAVSDASRKATGGPALRVGSTWAFLFVLVIAGLIGSCAERSSHADGVIAAAATGVLALANLGAYFMLRPRR